MTYLFLYYIVTIYIFFLIQHSKLQVPVQNFCVAYTLSASDIELEESPRFRNFTERSIGVQPFTALPRVGLLWGPDANATQRPIRSQEGFRGKFTAVEPVVGAGQRRVSWL